MSRWWTPCATAGVPICLLAVAQAASGQCQYEVAVVDGPHCGLWGGSASGRGISESGHVAGKYGQCSTGFNLPAMWTPEDGLVALPLLPESNRGMALDINQSGRVVGRVMRDGPGLPVYWEGGDVFEFVPGGPRGEAMAINDQGVAVGWHYNEALRAVRAVYWVDGTATELELPLGPHSWATNIDASGRIVGRMGSSILQEMYPFLWSTTTPAVNLGLPEGALTGSAEAINDRGWIGGNAVFEDDDDLWSKGWLLHDGVMTEFEPLWGFENAFVNDLNDAGQALVKLSGFFSGNPETGAAYLWHEGVITDIAELFPAGFDGVVGQAEGLNDAGQIIVEYSDGENSPFVVLTPVGRPPGDVNIDCRTDVDDLLLVILHWNQLDSWADANGDGIVDIDDVLMVLLNWT